MQIENEINDQSLFIDNTIIYEASPPNNKTVPRTNKWLCKVAGYKLSLKNWVEGMTQWAKHFF